MPRIPRSKQINENEVGVYHTTSRCVRRAFLMGEDSVLNQQFDHRRLWIMSRLIQLAAVFRIDIIGFAVLANHLHLILRNRPDLVKNMSDIDVVKTYYELSPQYRLSDGSPGRLTESRLAKLLNDSKYVSEHRERLSSISWFMWYLKQPLAAKANKEDKRSGHFFEGRFDVKKIESMEQLAQTMIYTDLNPIRAGVADSIESSDFTSGQLRYLAKKRRRELRKRGTPHAKRELDALDQAAVLNEFIDSFLSPIQMSDNDPIIEYVDRDESRFSCDPSPNSDSKETSTADLQVPNVTQGRNQSENGRRASDRGLLAISDEQYLQLLDTMGRRPAHGKLGAIPQSIPPILEALGADSNGTWLRGYDNLKRVHDGTYRTKVNADSEAARVRIRKIDPARSNQDAMM